MNAAEHIPGLQFIGYFCDPRVNGGAPTPRYEFKSPTPGKLDINTAEGWNALVDSQRKRNQNTR